MYSHGAVARPGFEGPRAIDLENVARLRAKGGLIGLTPGPPFYESADDFKSAIDHVATIPFEGRVGYEGIAIGSDFLESDDTLAELGDTSAIVKWVSMAFDQTAAELLLEDNARQFLANASGGEHRGGTSR
jgi:microsomal dipeptidase-like Zn-dependent dipeptidase